MRAYTRREFVAAGTTLAGALLTPPWSWALGAGQQADKHDRLSHENTPERLAAVLLSREEWRPFPTASDRAPWEALPAHLRRSLIEAGERRSSAAWPALPATLFLEFQRTGNRSHYEAARNDRRSQLRELVVAECLEGRDRFLDDIANGIWATCEESFWGVPAHLNLQKAGRGLPDVAEPVVDLFAGETSSLLAWTHYLLGAQLDRPSSLLRERIRREVDRRILTPCLERVDFWWMGFGQEDGHGPNNWNPWINSNWLTSTLLLETDPKRRAVSVHKILRSLDQFLKPYPRDGGCDEGPGYWSRAGGSLFDCLELLFSASRGALDFYRSPLIRDIARYIYRVHIHDDHFVNVGDAEATLHVNGDLISRFGRKIGDENMQAFGAFTAHASGFADIGGDSIGRQLPALFNVEELRRAPRAQPLLRDVWLPEIQVMAARRKEGSAQGLYLAAEGGHNAQSHNHNDVGNFIVYGDGAPAIVDVGVETYTAKTFGSQRYEIWTMQSAYHNLPTIDGVMQAAGREFEGRDVRYDADDQSAELNLDIAAAYPTEAGLDSWRRRLRLDRIHNEVVVTDRFVFKKAAARITQTLMTPVAPAAPGPGRLTLASPSFLSGPIQILFDAALTSSIEHVPIEDPRLKAVWGDRLYRILLTAEKPPIRGSWSLRIRQGV